MACILVASSNESGCWIENSIILWIVIANFYYLHLSIFYDGEYLILFNYKM